MPRLGEIAALAILVVGVACADEGVRHPVREAMPDPAGPMLAHDTLPPAALNSEAAARWAAVRRAILDARPGAVIGTLEGGGSSMFGAVTDVKIDERGQIYVLDRLNSAITVFDSVGTVLAGFGGEGEGPLEFRLPIVLGLLEDGTLVVEELGGALKRFEREEDGFAFLARTPIGGLARAMCVVGNRIFAESGFGLYEGLLAEYAADGPEEPLRSFGDEYSYGSEMTRMQMNQGSLACLANPARVAFGFRAQPRLDLYSAEGDYIWTAGVADYVQGWTVEDTRDDGRPVVTTGGFPSEWLVGLSAASDDYIVAVYRRQMSETAEAVPRAYLIDAATGWGALIGTMEGRVAAIGRGLYVTVLDGLYPRLRVWHMHAGSPG
ncbi:hypothetical protein [Candidatus Palauibacter sp.]|uniref:hypothetical protein n=1 Tax=Candidatus Palauibacter sp. TaxID=3101350 RepID=UPI003AF25CCF